MIFQSLTLILLSVFALSQAEEDVERKKILQAAREIMVTSRFCSLVTIGRDDYPQIRIMDPFPPTASFKVWLATNTKTRKVGEIKKNPRVAVNYFDRTGVSSVTLIGNAFLVDDSEKKAKLWKDEWSAFYSDLYRGDDYILIEIRPIRLEVVSYKHQIASEPKSWSPAIISFPEEE
jgi:general stress protein 26